jgi:SagB-type dehydrogenase family enzyme
MNKSINDIFTYHNETKHSSQRYARSLGYMDWSTQPDPFRSYTDTQKVSLPLSLQNPTPPYHLIFEENLPCAPVILESISQLFQFSLGLTAWKQAGADRWALRCNASSGNLHPTESYIILPPINNISDRSSISHYAPKHHQLEIVCEFDTGFWNDLEEDTFLLAISSITWREVWKYGERAFRYCSLDAGHAFRSVQISAMMLGWKVQLLDNIHDSDINRILGFDQDKRFIKDEKEFPDMLLAISPLPRQEIKIPKLLKDLPSEYKGTANLLSPSHQHWEMIQLIEKASFSLANERKNVHTPPIPRLPSMESKDLVLTRRSAQMMNRDNASINQEQFYTLLNSVYGSLDGFENSANLVIFVHSVQSLEKGLYILIRNKEHTSKLKRLMRNSFVWEEIREGFYLLEKGNFEYQAKTISCNQDIASDGAFSLGMLCEFSQQIQDKGAHRYKELYWECGAIGQQLYLEATSLGISATGIGCFLDDSFHYLLGLDSTQFQSLYHFTVGRAIVDSRLTTHPPYEL